MDTQGAPRPSKERLLRLRTWQHRELQLAIGKLLGAKVATNLFYFFDLWHFSKNYFFVCLSHIVD